jgi:hypothetical protein
MSEGGNTYNISGDSTVQFGGKHNTGKIVYQAPADARLALEDVIRLAEALRGQVGPADARVIEQSVDDLRRSGVSDHAKLRRALANIMGIATLVGQVGAPVIQASRAVLTALGIG